MRTSVHKGGDVGDPHVLNRQVSNSNLSAFFPKKAWLLIIVPEGYSFEVTKYPLPKSEQQRDFTMILEMTLWYFKKQFFSMEKLI